MGEAAGAFFSGLPVQPASRPPLCIRVACEACGALLEVRPQAGCRGSWGAGAGNAASARHSRRLSGSK